MSSSPPLTPARSSGDDGDDDNPSTTPPAAEEENPLAGVPELLTYPTTTSAEQISALKLVADSIAQQRQIASRSLLYHPLTVSLYVLVLALTSRALSYDTAPFLTTAIGISMAVLATAQWVTVGYLRAAEKIGWRWLGGEGEGGDLVVITRFGEEVIGTIIIRLVREGRRKALIRGWAVRIRFRGKGVGGNLLEEGVKIARERLGGGDVEVAFADDHANSPRILPNMFNGPFEKRDARARKALEGVLETEGLRSGGGETVVVQPVGTPTKTKGAKGARAGGRRRG
ncbi:hypothetical protein FGG08_000379 [Glutinoglossum americanum]|uniref:N-acetyltransferase domain-containing protein n=1 Tax=Glutinoglossum americanum TaxID=1670608 RepID=A0A9P8L1C2_9PEZI|nr:hypothetical protein FGG08_000379 [Glutinoglossum americanum]